MIWAILNSRKTQTRRIVKKWPPKIRLERLVQGDYPIGHTIIAKPGIYQPESNQYGALSIRVDVNILLGIKPGEFEWVCPHGQSGDRLWVRETISYYEDDKGKDYLVYLAGGTKIPLSNWQYPHPVYDHCIGKFDKTIPAIYMPKWASRITLEIINVNIERLQDISEKDAIVEGIELCPATKIHPALESRLIRGSIHIDRFARLWDSMNKKRGFKWDKNSWVWVITFRRINID